MERKLQKERQSKVTLQTQVSDLTDQLEQQRTVVDSALSRLARPRQAEVSWFERAGWVVAVLALATLAFASSRRGRLPVPAAPDVSGDRLASAADELEWRIEAAEEAQEAEERAPVGVR
jgi:hypothetical protein